MSTTLVGRVQISRSEAAKKNGRDTNVHLPAPLGQALYEQGYTTVDVHVTTAGILLVPNKDLIPERIKETMDLPAW